MDIGAEINDIQKKIFCYDLQGIMEQVTNLMTEILEKNRLDLNNSDILRSFNDIMQNSMQAFMNKDYLLLADLLEYRLIPLLNYDKRRMS